MSLRGAGRVVRGCDAAISLPMHKRHATWSG